MESHRAVSYRVGLWLADIPTEPRVPEAVQFILTEGVFHGEGQSIMLTLGRKDTGIHCEYISAEIHTPNSCH